MSSFYDDASLVVIPSGYKTSKVYAEKPTDGSGDLAFTRTGDTATRVNSAGIIEKVRTNIVLQSETFATTWAPTSASVSSNVTTAPNGALTADKLIASVSAVTQHRLDQTTTSAIGTNVFSVYAKKAELSFIQLRVGSSGAYFNLDNGTTSDLVGVTSAIQDAGNGWYRCIITCVSVAANEIVRINLASAIGVNSFAGNGTSGAFIWGAQFEVSDFGPTAYIPTTTAAVSIGPTANTARLDYLGSTCPRLILEGQRTNLVTFSEQLNNAAWTKDRVTVTANVTTAPDGTVSAEKVVDTLQGNNAYRIYNGATLSAISYSASFYVKAAEYSWVYIRIGNSLRVWFNVTTGVVGGADSGMAGRIENAGNGWYRCTAIITTATAGGGFALLGLTNANNVETYTPTTGGQGVFVWGAQLEAGAYATSYIPTLAASATRSVDDATKTGITSLIGQTEGTLFLDFEGGANDSANHFLGLSDGTTGNRIVIVRSSSNTLYAQIRVGGVEQAFIQTATLTANTRYKCAIAYKANDIAFYVNGALVGTDTSATIPATSVFATNTGVSSSFFERAINQTLVFKTRLTNAELATLTTL
jgi:hypothetical protein